MYALGLLLAYLLTGMPSAARLGLAEEREGFSLNEAVGSLDLGGSDVGAAPDSPPAAAIRDDDQCSAQFSSPPEAKRIPSQRTSQRTRDGLVSLARSMLEHDPAKRPSAESLLALLIA